MTMQPIIEDGKVVDEYDDGLPEETVSAPPQETIVPTTDSPPATTVPEVSTQPIGVQREDPSSFDQSDVSIQILLHRTDGGPQGRLVSIIIHNFSGKPVIETFREAELTDKSRLDSIHRAIYPLMQRFLLDLSGRAQQKLQEEAKRAATPIPPKTITPATPTQTTPMQPSSPVSPTSPAQTEPTSKRDNKKKSKYQTIPMF